MRIFLQNVLRIEFCGRQIVQNSDFYIRFLAGNNYCTRIKGFKRLRIAQIAGHFFRVKQHADIVRGFKIFILRNNRMSMLDNRK